jgi:hypothetical protein
VLLILLNTPPHGNAVLASWHCGLHAWFCLLTPLHWLALLNRLHACQNTKSKKNPFGG